MSTSAKRLGGALSLLALLALTAAGLAAASSPPPVKPADPGKVKRVGQSSPGSPAPATAHPTVYRLAAKLVPAGASGTATGHWAGVLLQTAALPGCPVVPKSGAPPQIKCGGSSSTHGSLHWLLDWKLTYSHLSSSVTSADIHITVAAGAAPVTAAHLCSTGCRSGRFGRTILTDAQANAVVAGQATVVVGTANHTGGEISGPIVRVQPSVTHK